MNFLSKTKRHKIVLAEQTWVHRKPLWFHDFFFLSNFMDFSREIRVVKSQIVQNRRGFTIFLCFPILWIFSREIKVVKKAVKDKTTVFSQILCAFNF